MPRLVILKSLYGKSFPTCVLCVYFIETGSDDIKCCTKPTCSTPSGSGTCVQTSQCGGTSIAGYCDGPANLQRFVMIKFKHYL